MVLVGYWPLNEASGDALDYTSNYNHGTVNGATQGATGILNQNAYSFNSSNNEYVSLPQFSSSEWSIASWCYFTSTSDNHDAAVGLGSTDGGKGESRIQFKSQEIETYVDGSSAFATFTENLNSWKHLALTHDGSGYSYYVDGIEIDTSSLSTNLNEFENVYIGRCRFTDNVGTKEGYHDGRVCETRFYNHALSSSEISYLYETAQQGIYTSSVKKAVTASGKPDEALAQMLARRANDFEATVIEAESNVTTRKAQMFDRRNYGNQVQ